MHVIIENNKLGFDLSPEEVELIEDAAASVNWSFDQMMDHFAHCIGQAVLASDGPLSKEVLYHVLEEALETASVNHTKYRSEG